MSRDNFPTRWLHWLGVFVFITGGLDATLDLLTWDTDGGGVVRMWAGLALYRVAQLESAEVRR